MIRAPAVTALSIPLTISAQLKLFSPNDRIGVPGKTPTTPPSPTTALIVDATIVPWGSVVGFVFSQVV